MNAIPGFLWLIFYRAGILQNPLDTKFLLLIHLSQSVHVTARLNFSHYSGDLSVTKKEIVKAISEELGLTQLKTKEIVQKTFDAIVETLVEDRRIELRNFGVFEVKKRAARRARNPRTNDSVEVPEKFVVTFKPGKEMEERVRLLDDQASQPEPQAGESQSNPVPEMGASSGSDTSAPVQGGSSLPESGSPFTSNSETPGFG